MPSEVRQTYGYYRYIDIVLLQHPEGNRSDANLWAGEYDGEKAVAGSGHMHSRQGRNHA